MDNKEKETTQINAEKIIEKMVKDKNKEIKLTEMQIRGVLQAARNIFLQQPIFLQLQAPIKIVGDIHGQYTDLIRIFEAGGYPHEANYLFLGDYVDRGKQSIEVMVLLLAYKLQYPQNFFMLRGNHESAQINKLYGFYDECKRKYSIKLWKMFTDVFNVMPVCALIQQKIICMHGGLSPQMANLKKIASINRPTDIPTSGLLCDLLWSDPAQQVRGWNENAERGISYLFGPDVLTNFLKTNDLDLVCRSHQIVEQGYEFFGKRQLVTVFSACNYCGMFDNWGALMSVDSDLICSFHIIKPETKSKNNGSGSKKRPKTPKYIN